MKPNAADIEKARIQEGVLALLLEHLLESLWDHEF